MDYTLPSEWHEQSAVQLTWPHADTDWQKNLADIESVYLEIAKAITDVQLLIVACHNESVLANVRRLFTEHHIDTSRLRFFIAPCNDTWARDHGGITLIPKNKICHSNWSPMLLDFTFNAWGDKYAGELDNQITGMLKSQQFCQSNRYKAFDFVLEGGSIESDGAGTLMTTSRCLLNPNRNNGQSRSEIETTLKQTFGIDNVLWLEHGYLAGDDTDAHIDTLARFAPNAIVYVHCDDILDPHYDELAKMEAQLKTFTNLHGEAYTLYALPMPQPIRNSEGELLPATYANYLIINGAVLVPTYNDSADDTALTVIAKAYPDRKVIPIDCRPVIEQFGSLHCLTMQYPAGLIK